MMTAERLNAIKGTKHVRLFDIEEDADTTTREITISFSSENDEVETRMGIEILGHQPGEVDMERLAAGGAPVLWMHNWDDQRGVVVRAWIDSNAGRGYAVVRLSRSPLGQQLLQDINDGIVTKVSVGYEVRAGHAIDDDTYRVTRWWPYEISFVSIPADNSVGVGRSYSPQEQAFIAEIQAAGPSHRLAALVRGLPDFTHTITQETRSKMIVTPTTTTHAPSNIIRAMITEAENAPSLHFSYDGNGDVKRVTPIPHGSRNELDIRSLSFPALTVGDHNTYMPRGTEAGKATTMATEIARRSVVAQAGANIVVIPFAPNSLPGEVMTRTNSGLIVVQPANVAPVADGAEIPVSDLPFLRADIDRATIPMLGVEFSLPRSVMRQYFYGELPDILMASIGMGITNALDALLLGALDAANLGAFSLGAAAGKSLTFGELRGVIGTSGTGATVNENRELTVSGVLAELSSETANTYIAAWDRMGIALASNITLITKRDSAASGSVAVTALLNAMPLVPDASYAWKVA